MVPAVVCHQAAATSERFISLFISERRITRFEIPVAQQGMECKTDIKG